VQANASSAIRCRQYPRYNLKRMNQEIPIGEVAQRLGLTVRGTAAFCWRMENHSNGDHQPSMYIERRNNRIRCAVCDDKSLSPLDLIMARQNLAKMGYAIQWMVEQFSDLAQRLIAEAENSAAARSDVAIPRWLIADGYLASLPCESQSVLVSLLGRQQAGSISFAYWEIMQDTGIRSKGIVRQALARFISDGLMRQESNPASRKRSFFSLTWTSTTFRKRLDELREQQRRELERQAARKLRESQNEEIPW
jgi:hypothetical protein